MEGGGAERGERERERERERGGRRRDLEGGSGGRGKSERYTVEPPIRDPPRQGRPLYIGHLLQPHVNTYVTSEIRTLIYTLVYYFIPKIGMTSLQGTKSLAP